MKPIKLTIQGFTCFREHTEVDFTDMQLYAIQGQTGSGKSSLLDAMTFALYGRTPRLGGRGMDALISQGERGLAVALEFEAGGERYRVARTWGRRTAENDLRFEQYKEGRAINLAENKKAQIQDLVTKAVGLDFEAFTRAVLLPQGQFDTFLKGSDKDRQKLLGDLMNMAHVRRMFEVAGERGRDLKTELGGVQALLDGEYAGVSVELLTGWREEAERMEAEAQRLTGEREATAADVTRLTQLVGWLTERDAARRTLEGLEAQAEPVAAGARRAATARRVAGALPLLDAARRAQAAAHKADADLQVRQQAVRAAQAVLGHAAEALLHAEQAGARIPELEAQAERLRDAEGLQGTLRRYGGKPDASHARPLPWDEDAFLRARDAAQKGEQLRRDRVTLDAERAGAQARRTRVLADETLQNSQEVELARTEAEGRQAGMALTQAQARLADAQARAGLAAHRAHLHLGEPCPLCTQTVTALPDAPTEDLSALTAEVKALEGTRDRLRERFADLRSAVRERARTLEAARAELRDWEQAVQGREADLKALEATLDPQAAETTARLMAGLAGQLRSLGGDPAARRRALLAEIQMARQDEQQARTAQAQAASALAAAQAGADAAAGTAHLRAGERTEAAEAARQALSALGLDEASARAAALPEAEVLRLEAAQRDFDAQLGRVREALRILEVRLEGQKASPEALRTRERDLAATEAALGSARERLGALTEQVRSGEERLRRKQDLEGRAASLAREYDTWNALAQSLRANEFQQYLLQEVEAQLLTRAGELLFEISDGRYRLVLVQGDYAVQDLWNAGETRGVKTLSGGETFLASLSLAIALSDYLAGNRILGALFLDEGFGTLDPQALESVALALENLRTQGRMVGVITHVESLSERMPARILVTKSVAGSRAQRIEG